MRRLRGMRVVAAGAILALAATVGVPIASAASIEPALSWPAVQLAGEANANHLISDRDGGVRVACGTALRTIGAGSISSTVPVAPVSPTPDVCQGKSAVGKDGVTYSDAQSADGDFVVAYQGSDRLWSFRLPCPVNALRVGADGNVYVVASGAGSVRACPTVHLIGLKPTAAAGQTSPTKIFDVDLGDHSVPTGGLAAYSGGLVVRYRDGLQFASYSGAFGTQYGVDSIPTPDAQFDATMQGRVFVAQRADATTRSICHDDNVADQIRGVEPTSGAWSYALPQCSRVLAAQPAPDSGVVIDLSYPNGGSTIRQLTMIKSDQTVGWSYPLPETDPDNTQVAYGKTAYAVDLNGSVLLQRGFTRYSATDGQRWPGIRLTMISPTGSVSGSYEFAGDPSDSSDAGRGYYPMNGEVAMAEGVAFVLANRCDSWGQCRGDESLYAVKVAGLRLDYPRGYLLGAGGPVPPTPQPTVRNYVALGDSYGSIEGVSPFEAGTDVASGDINFCHRSTRAYARLLAADTTLRLRIGDRGFRACSGAKIPQITGPWPVKGPDNEDGRNQKEGAQTQALSSATDIVTLSISGNDAGFSDLAIRCLLLDCSTYRAEYLKKVAELKGKLSGAYDAILKNAPNAHVYVVGYPQLLSAKRPCSSTNSWMKALDGLLKTAKYGGGSLGTSARAQVAAIAKTGHFTPAEMSKIGSKATFTAAEQTFVRDFVAAIDRRIEAVVATKGARMTYVDPLAARSPFIGHELCTKQSYFHGVEGKTPAYSFHPVYQGSKAFAALLRPLLVIK